ncbi:MAG TPA: GNAT family protein [Rhodoblastus sp.]|nr:GNAT family protein [Rhodoblastus sp.]
MSQQILDPTPAPAPRPIILQGRTARLEKLEGARLDALYDALHDETRDETWRYMFFGPFANRAAFRAQWEALAGADDPFFFAVLDATGQKLLGALALMRIDRPNRVIEIGHVLFSPDLQRSIAATEAHYLVARHVFEDLGYRRYEWKCDDRNLRSKNAALRLGFRAEGLFRQHMIVKGRNRDTAWFAMLDLDWPARRAALEAWLDPENFDGDGRQKRRLADFQS